MDAREPASRLPFYYGWVIFAVTFLIYLFMFGLRYSMGVFFTPIQREFGWSTATTASAVTIFFWVYALASPFVGRLAERIGVRKTVLIGGLLLGGGGALVSLVKELWHLYLFWGVIAGTGASALYVIPTMVLARFFDRRRGVAVGWSSVGVSIGQAVLVPLAALSINEYGWRMTIQALGLLVVFATSIIGYAFLREDPESMGLRADGDGRAGASEPQPGGSTGSRERVTSPWGVFRTRSFDLIFLSYFFAVGGIISILTYVVPHMISVGIDPVQAGGAFGLIGVTSAAGSFVFGIVSDRLGRRATIIITTSGLALSFFTASILPANLALLYSWAILYGLTYGGCPEQYAAITADYFGHRYGATLFGLLTLGGCLGGGLFPLICGWLVDLTNAYHAALLFLAAGMCVAPLLMLKVKRPVQVPQ